jgi:thioredoxin 1
MADGVLELTDQNFDSEVLKSSQPVLVDFWAEWCMPCRMLAPTISALAAEFAGKVKVGKVDTDSNREVAVQFEITALPTILLFKDGQVIRKFVGGATPKRDFVAELQKALGAPV